jgi:MoaA/NifB/PqqE/SkfB family radical SAM enzyme
MEAIEWADEAGLPLQINTTFSRCNIDDFERAATLIESKKIALWSVFFLVPTGRGKLDDLLWPTSSMPSSPNRTHSRSERVFTSRLRKRNCRFFLQ